MQLFAGAASFIVGAATLECTESSMTGRGGPLLVACHGLRSTDEAGQGPTGHGNSSLEPALIGILFNLEKNSPESASIQEVRDSLADKMSDASRLIDRLVKKGYIDKFPSDFDRRSNRVRISDSGLEILREVNSRKENLDGIVNDLLSDKEIKELNRLLSLLK